MSTSAWRRLVTMPAALSDPDPTGPLSQRTKRVPGRLPDIVRASVLAPVDLFAQIHVDSVVSLELTGPSSRSRIQHLDGLRKRPHFMPEATRRVEQKQTAPEPSTCGQVAAVNPRGSEVLPQANVSQCWSQSLLVDRLLGDPLRRHGGAVDFLPWGHIPLSPEA
jgi:hypothetical protein